MTEFLSTRSGLIAEHAIVRIGPLCIWDRKENDHEIDYTHGNGPEAARSTTATEVAVQEFLEAQP